MKTKTILSFIAIIPFLFGCSKSNSVTPKSTSNNISMQLAGNWEGTKNNVTFTNASGNIQTINIDYGDTFNLLFDSALGNATKRIEPTGAIFYTASYTITQSNGKNDINFAINGTGTTLATRDVESYVITSFGNGLMVLNRTSPTFTSKDTNGVITTGTNAVYEEDYVQE